MTFLLYTVGRIISIPTSCTKKKQFQRYLEFGTTSDQLKSGRPCSVNTASEPQSTAITGEKSGNNKLEKLFVKFLKILFF